MAIDNNEIPRYIPNPFDANEQIDTYKEPKLFEYLGIPNIVDKLSDEELDKIGLEVVDNWEDDATTRAPREESMQKAIDLAMQVKQEKSFPWPNASNVKFPLMTNASIHFGAKTYPAIVQDGNVCKGKIYGEDIKKVPQIDPNTGQPAINPETGEQVFQKVPLGKKERAERVSKFINWQLMEDMPYWEQDIDKMCHILPIVGCMFKKTYYNSIEERVESILIPAQDIYIRYDTRNIDKSTRITHVFELTHNELIERINSGIYVECDELGEGDGGVLKTRLNYQESPEEERESSKDYYLILEQHTWLDLDGDGYKEPYIVTVLESQSKVLRIFPRFDRDSVQYNDKGKIQLIEAINYFTKYGFIPSADGSIYDTGFGELLYPINESVNSVLNQLIDSGTLANTRGGLIGGNLRIKAGSMKFRPGEWKIVNTMGQDIRNNIVELNNGEPSSVLFQLLGFLVESGGQITSIKDLADGQLPVNAPATTALAIIEQGMSAFKAIYKRIHRSLKEELKKIYRLNKNFLSRDKYNEVLDNQEDNRADFDYKDYDIVPVSDPSIVSDMQRLTKAQALLQFLQDPMVDGLELRKRYFEALGIEDIDSLLVEPQPPQPDPMAEQNAQLQLESLQAQVANLKTQNSYYQKQMEKIDNDIAIEQDKNEQNRLKILSDIQTQEVRVDADTTKKIADSVEAMAKAEERELGMQNQIYINQLNQGKERLLDEQENKLIRQPIQRMGFGELPTTPQGQPKQSVPSRVEETPDQQDSSQILAGSETITGE